MLLDTRFTLTAVSIQRPLPPKLTLPVSRTIPSILPALWHTTIPRNPLLNFHSRQRMYGRSRAGTRAAVWLPSSGIRLRLISVQSMSMATRGSIRWKSIPTLPARMWYIPAILTMDIKVRMLVSPIHPGWERRAGRTSYMIQGLHSEASSLLPPTGSVSALSLHTQLLTTVQAVTRS